MRIAIIGAGTVGRGLAEAAVSCRHDVVLAARNPDHAAKAAGDVGARAAASAEEAVQGADLVVLAVPSTALADVCDEIRRHVEQTVVIDPTNPMEPDPALLLEATLSVAEEIAILLPAARVVKAFNTVLGARLTDPVVHGVRLDGFYAGDDPEAKALVAGLVAAMGFRPLDVGDLRSARSLEHMAYLNISLNARYGWSWSSGWKLLGDTGEDPPTA
jgi:8-hydroxy-5-deazaflavin:NADPH oxidoreductase